MARVLHVRYSDGSSEMFGVPDDYSLPLDLEVEGMDWLVIPSPKGEPAAASIAVRLRHVAWMTAATEVQEERPAEVVER